MLSETARKVIESRLPKAVVLPNCVDLGGARSFDRPEAVILLFGGRISTPKGINVLYDALASAFAKGIRFRFIMSGAGPDAELTSHGFREYD